MIPLPQSRHIPAPMVPRGPLISLNNPERHPHLFAVGVLTRVNQEN
jgi:hypothetical protein